MKNVMFLLAIIGCLALVIAGKFHWDEKIERSVQPVSAEEQSSSKLEDENEKVIEQPISNDELKELVANFPEQLQEKMMASNDPISVVMMGSESFGTKESGLQPIVEKGLESSYWKGAFTVEQLTFKKETTEAIVEEKLYKDVIEKNPDVVILEAFTLNDNGNVTIDEGHQNISTIISKLKEGAPGVSVILMPSNPIPDPQYYSYQISALAKYAEVKDLVYLDHWKEWPSVDGDKINDYLLDARPNDKGFEVWGDVIVDYMSGK
ncbi:SGNH/GDSL hydrolase family protein [Pseudalkalibacillus hwajinpoensis]|uniref:SGNH/GDSL hydrolase family protein n=1 Tax=Guptibacillus hwajinpoensis TaxID=208199 RepID=A0A4U1MK60_9BACL|nr:SGNH/GDSL hydrolase family protein [Pseudalkalibacillus hwajinpoensis]TKD70965.1 SGNH/GDSL hydrolase family protein [Pseudalkalibacillus hwajinpoensis]